MSKVVLICGATGKQGGSVVHAILASAQAKDFTILALTRNPDGGSAQKLKSQGCKIVKGDLTDVPAIFDEVKKVESQPVWGVFSVQTPLGKDGFKAEETEGKALIDGALANNVKFFVYTSVDRGGDDKSFDNPTPIPHFISKHNIEHHLVEKADAKGEKMQWTILRPVAFMDNLTPNFMGKGFASMWKVAMKDRPLQVISTKDIGHFAAQAFIHPSEFNGRSISLAGDSLTFQQMAKVFKEKTGKDVPLTFDFLARIMLWAIGDVGVMFKWFYTDGYGSDIQMLRKEYPGLLSFGDWLVKESKFETT